MQIIFLTIGLASGLGDFYVAFWLESNWMLESDLNFKYKLEINQLLAV